MIVLVAGYKGFIGKHLQARLENDGHHVIEIGRNTLWDGNPPDVIINCAAELYDEDVMFESNVLFTKYLLDYAKEHNVRKFIQIGSSSEYGLTNLPRKEDMVCIPSNIYEGTKLAATALCQAYAAKYNMDVCVARPFSVYGPNDKARKLIPKLYESYLDHKTIDLYAGSHDWIYVTDFVEGIVTLMNANPELTKGDIVNFGTGISSTNWEVVDALEEALNGSLFINRKDGKYHSHDVENWVADISKANSKYGWEPKFDLRSGIKELIMNQWFEHDKG